MKNSLKTVEIADGVFFNTVTDERFKTNRISVNIITELKENSVTTNALISQLLKKGFKGCETYTELNRKLEQLYGAYIESDVQKRGDYQIITVAITGIDDKFTLDNEKISRELSEILCNLVLNPVIEGDGFKKDYVELEKKALIDTIEAELNEKRIYALNNAIKLMCKNEPYGLPKYGFKDKVDEITASSAKKQYDEIIKKSRIEIIFTGCGDDSSAIEVMKEKLNSAPRSYAEPIKTTKHIQQGDIKEETERIAVNQSKLVLGFSSGTAENDKAVAATRLMNSILGGTPSSKLFVNVREKLSLCYYCAARYDIMKGIITIDSGVETQNIEKAKTAILEQLEEIKKGNFTDEETSFAILSLKNSFSSVYESDSVIESYYLGKRLISSSLTPDDEKKQLDNVTREEIIEAAKNVKLDTIYLLTENGEKE